MRLEKRDIEAIKQIKDFIPADIYIYGSRLDNTKKGGDVDILLVPKISLTPIEKVKLKMKIKSFLEEKIYKPVDIVFENQALGKENGIKID